MVDDEARDEAADDCVSSYGKELQDILRSSFLAGAAWEREAIIRRIDDRRGQAIRTVAADAGELRSPRSPRSGKASDRPEALKGVGRKGGTASEEVLAVVMAAGEAGIAAAEILDKLRGAEPRGGQRDNTLLKALRRLRKVDKVAFDGKRYRPFKR